MQAAARPTATYVPARNGVVAKPMVKAVVKPLGSLGTSFKPKPPLPSVSSTVPPGKKLIHSNVSLLARECGVSEAAISYHYNRGKTPDQVREHFRKSGKVGVPASQALYQPTPKVVAQPSAEDAEVEQSGVAETEYAARRRKEIALANKQELEVAQRMGELVPRVQVNQFIAGQIIRVRDELLKIGPEKQDALAAEGDAAKCGKIVTDAVRRTLEMMAEYG